MNKLFAFISSYLPLYVLLIINIVNYEILTITRYRWLARQLSKYVKTDYHVGSYYIASVHKLPEKLLVEKAKWAGTSIGYCIRVL